MDRALLERLRIYKGLVAQGPLFVAQLRDTNTATEVEGAGEIFCAAVSRCKQGFGNSTSQ